ncbi:MAG TPA: type II toxin-antitoxin system VapC family toxin [Chloroflexota bacterium]|nr:type II toxin-antitoxin system VapC family toxin [Chloroflexota bacterium]
MRLLLDTHTLLWWLGDDPTLTGDARRAIEDEDIVVAVSAASIWEIALKRALGKVEVPDDIVAAIEANDFVPPPMTLADGLAAGSLPVYHRDPFDRILVAQALAGGFTIVSRDPRLEQYGVAVLRT